MNNLQEELPEHYPQLKVAKVNHPVFSWLSLRRDTKEYKKMAEESTWLVLTKESQKIQMLKPEATMNSWMSIHFINSCSEKVN
jgi:hypothetical protein